MYYIYCYTNNFNNKKYIGQTIYPARRFAEHKYAAFTPDNPEYNLLFHRKLREYGIENFTITILEELDTTDTNYVDGRELYWINKEQSFVKDNGYNLTLGGLLKGRHKLLEKEKIDEVINLLTNTTLSYNKINQQTGVSLKSIVNINRGTYAGCPNLKYPIRKPKKINDETKNNIIELLRTTNLTRLLIADEMGVSLSTVKRIKASLLKTLEPVSTIEG